MDAGVATRLSKFLQFRGVRLSLIGPSFAAEKALLLAEGWLASMPLPLRDAITVGWSWQVVVPNQALSHGGDEVGGIIGIASGTALVFSAIGTVDAGPIHLFRAPFWFGLLPATEGRPRILSVVARTECIIVRVPQSVIASLFALQPQLWRHMHALTMTHLEMVSQTASDLAVRDSKRRLIAVLLRLGGLRWSGDDAVSLEISQEDVSSMANVSRQTTIVIFSDLKANGLLKTGYRSISIMAPSALRALLNPEK